MRRERSQIRGWPVSSDSDDIDGPLNAEQAETTRVNCAATKTATRSLSIAKRGRNIIRPLFFVNGSGRVAGDLILHIHLDQPPAKVVGGKCSSDSRNYFWVSWMRLPHVSSKTAIFTSPNSIGEVVNTTPSSHNRSYSL